MMDAEASIEVPTNTTAVNLHHTRCGSCRPEVALCGSPLAGAEASVNPSMGGSFCVVCFSGAELTCPSCGTPREGVTP